MQSTKYKVQSAEQCMEWILIISKKCEKVEKVEQCMEWMLIISNKCEKIEKVEKVDKY